LLLVTAPLGSLRAGPDRHAERHAVEPVADKIGLGERARLPGQKQESRLESVFRSVPVAEHPPAGAEDHRPVPANQGGKGGFVSAGSKAAQQLAVCLAADSSRTRDVADIAEDGGELSSRHGSGPPWLFASLLKYCLENARCFHFFFVDETGYPLRTATMAQVQRCRAPLSGQGATIFGPAPAGFFRCGLSPSPPTIQSAIVAVRYKERDADVRE